MQQRQNIDAATWEACKHGDKQAYAVIYKMYYSHLYAYGLKFTTDTSIVEDCIQEIFTAFWFNRQKLSAIRLFHNYLFVSFRNRLLRDIQQHKLTTTAHPDNGEYIFDLQLSADQVMIDAEKMYEQSINLNDAINKLTPRQQEVVYLKFYQDLSYDEIAAMLGISVKATYKLLARAICELRQTYQQKISSLTLSISTLIISLMLLS